jgi:hypothetical protein
MGGEKGEGRIHGGMKKKATSDHPVRGEHLRG